MRSFISFINEANGIGSEFEQKTANMVQRWLKANALNGKYEAKRFQSISEDNGNRDEDYSDVVVEEIKTGKKFFIECKEFERSNVLNIQYDIKENGDLVPVKGKKREAFSESESNAVAGLTSAIRESEGYAKFIDFLNTRNKLIKNLKPVMFWSADGENEDAARFVKPLISEYNKFVKSGKAEADCKPFDPSKLRESTLNQLVCALCWRLSDPDRTWDICKIDSIPGLGKLVRRHYTEGKAESAAYIQFGDDKLFRTSDENPLGLKDIPIFPTDIDGEFTLKFTPRFGTGSIYVTPRSEIKTEMESDFSFIDKDRWPDVEKRVNEDIQIQDDGVYLANMAKSFGDKAWFIDEIDPEIDTIVDFGGGAGEFCEFIERKLRRDFGFIVIDNNPSFKSAAESKGFRVFENLAELRSWDGFRPDNTLLNMSSVIHEVYSYSDPFYDDVGVFWTDVKKCGFRQISIRDMSFNPSDYRNVPVDAVCWIYQNVFNSDLAILSHGGAHRSLKSLTESFESVWGAICDPEARRVNVKNLLHFLIKYRYIENWDREVEENYLPVSQDKLASIIRGMGYSFTHRESSKLEFYGKTWDKDFKLNRPDSFGYRREFSDWLKTLNTHIKWMFGK